jgi:hypothetical protein
MLKKLVIVSSLLLCGCVSIQNIPMEAAVSEEMKGKALIVSKREKPDFAAMTPAAPVFALIGGLAMIGVGNGIVRSNNIEDPADYIAAALSADLRTKYDLQVSPSLMPVSTDEVAQLPKGSSGADLLLDVRTINWAFVYFPTTWNRYRVRYSARLRLVDIKNGRVLVEGKCSRMPEEEASAPSYDELLANGAQRLKAELRKAADYCIDEFSVKTLLQQPQARTAPMETAVQPQAAPAAVDAATPQPNEVGPGRGHRRGRRFWEAGG